MRAALPSHSPSSSVGIDSLERAVYQRRRHIRYPIRVAVTVQWLAPRGQRGSLKARTRDISEGGAFVLSRTAPPLGAIVELSIQLPVKQTGEASCRLEMQGEVFRVETPTGHESRWGFAVNAIKTVMHRPEACPVLSAQE